MVIVGGLECGNVGVASRTRISEIVATPHEALAAKLLYQDIAAIRDLRPSSHAGTGVWQLVGLGQQNGNWAKELLNQIDMP